MYRIVQKSSLWVGVSSFFNGTIHAQIHKTPENYNYIYTVTMHDEEIRAYGFCSIDFPRVDHYIIWKNTLPWFVNDRVNAQEIQELLHRNAAIIQFLKHHNASE